MMELVQRSDCPFCWKVRLGLAVAGASYQSTMTVLGQKHPTVLNHNPKQSVPVLIDGETVMWESTVMLEYLDDVYAEGRLYAGSGARRALTRTRVAYSDGVVGPALRDLVFERRSKRSADQDPSLIERSLESWQQVQRELDAMLDGQLTFSEGFGAADCALLARVGVADAYDAGPTASTPQLKAWYERSKQRPWWDQAYPTSFIRPTA